MTFDYTSIVSLLPGSADFALLRRPEIPITVIGRKAAATYIALVDTGSDNTIFPKSVAKHLGISLKKATGPAATVFGGAQVQLQEGEPHYDSNLGKSALNGRLLSVFLTLQLPKKSPSS